MAEGREDNRLEIQKNMNAAAQVSQMRQSVSKGKTFRARYVDQRMRPTLVPGDVLEIGGCTVIEYKPGDLVYFHTGEDFQVRKIARHTMSGADMAFSVKSEDGDEFNLAASQIIGRVVTIHRKGEAIQIIQTRGEQLEHHMRGGLRLIEGIIDRIRDFIGRKR
jgi:hypothetical protein